MRQAQSEANKYGNVVVGAKNNVKGKSNLIFGDNNIINGNSNWILISDYVGLGNNNITDLLVFGRWKIILSQV